MSQQDLFSTREEISDLVIARYDDAKSMLRFAAEVSGKPLKAIADEIEMDDKQFTRCLSYNPNDNRHFPFELANRYQDVIGNEIPLRWQALKRGYGLVRLKTSLEIENEQLKRELEEARKEQALMMKLVKEIKG